MRDDRPRPPSGTRSEGRGSVSFFLIPLLWAVALTAAFAVPLARIPWPFGDVYEVLLKAEGLDWRTTVVGAFRERVEYRPFFTLAVKLLYGTNGLQLWFYKALVLVQFATIFAVLAVILRPATLSRSV